MKHDFTLRRQLKREIPSALTWMNYLQGPPPPDSTIPATVLDWEPRWLAWFTDVLAHVDSSWVVERVAPAIAAALSQNDLFLAAYLTRRLAAELGEDEWSARQLFMTAKHALCDSGAYDAQPFEAVRFAASLIDMFSGAQRTVYVVTIHVAPVPISRFAFDRVTALISRRSGELVVQGDVEGQRTLQGISCEVEASHPEQAAANALIAAANTLETLKLRFYAITRPQGPMKVIEKNSGAETWVRLPEPFWRKQPGVRAVPTVPGFATVVKRLTDEEKEQWWAARWHLSLAFADWSEDMHAAAAEMWQALESFVPDNGKDALGKVLALVGPYLAVLPREMGTFEVSRISSQAAVLEKNFTQGGRRLQWFYWASTKMTLEKWLGRVLDTRSHQHFAKWSPPAPLVAFAQGIGLIQVIYQRMENPAMHTWMERRLEGDLALLYGLRNKVVHAGRRVLPSRAAEYLARVGAEMILTLMQAR